MQKLKIVCFSILTSFIFQSCNQDEKKTTDMARFQSLKEQEFIIDTNADTTIVGAKETVFRIPAQIFMNPDGETINGLVKIRIIECYSRRDIIESQIETTYKDDLLISFGFFNIEAYDMDGKKLLVKKNKSLTAVMDTVYADKKLDPEVFYGKVNNSSREVEWEMDTSFSEKSLIVYNEVGAFVYVSVTGYEINIPKLGWVNLDYIYELPEEEKSDIVVTTDKSFNGAVFVVFKNIRSVVQSNVFQNGEVIFSDLPKGENVVLLAYGIGNNGPFLGVREVVIGKDLKTYLEVKPSSLEEIKDELEKLNY